MADIWQENETKMNILETAFNWLTKGIAVIPVRYMDKKPLIPWAQYQTVLPTVEELVCWFATDHVNLAVVTGWRGLVVLDFDSMDSWNIWKAWARYEAVAGYILDHTYKVMTARGVHVYVFLDQPVKMRPMGFMDIKASGGYVLAPPSVHPTGVLYLAMDESAEICRCPSLECLVPAAWLEQPEAVVAVQVEHKAVDLWDKANNAAEPVGISVEEIKQNVRIESFFSHLYPSSKGYMLALCPLHDDHHPSMWVDTKNQICGCYAGCNGGKSLDAIDLFARLHQLSNSEAIRELAERI
jgi:hypothetical protein